jgi:protein-disulfide isomerase
MTRLSRAAALLIVLAGLPASPSGAGADEFTPAQRAEIVAIMRDALKHDPTILRDAVTALQTDDVARQAAESQAALAANHDALMTSADPVAGNPHGDVTIVEFFDTRCPYCRKLEPAMAELLVHDHGVRLVYKDLPILGPASVLGSKALLAAQNQGGYEKLRAAIMAAPPQTTKAMIQDAAQHLGLDWHRLEHDMDNPAIQARMARTIVIEGTPALVIGGEMIPGAVEMADLTTAIAKARKAK